MKSLVSRKRTVTKEERSELARLLGSLPAAEGKKRGRPSVLHKCPKCGSVITGRQAKRMDKNNPHICPQN